MERRLGVSSYGFERTEAGRKGLTLCHVRVGVVGRGRRHGDSRAVDARCGRRDKGGQVAESFAKEKGGRGDISLKQLHLCIGIPKNEGFQERLDLA